MADDLEAFGASPAQVARLRARAAEAAPDQGLDVHPDNGVAVRLLLAAQTQWRMTALTTATSAVIIRTGLDYPAVETAARLARLELDEDDFARLRLLEVTALNAWSEERAAR